MAYRVEGTVDGTTWTTIGLYNSVAEAREAQDAFRQQVYHPPAGLSGWARIIETSASAESLRYQVVTQVDGGYWYLGNAYADRPSAERDISEANEAMSLSRVPVSCEFHIIDHDEVEEAKEAYRKVLSCGALTPEQLETVRARLRDLEQT